MDTYCLYCRRKTGNLNPKTVMVNNRLSMQSICSVCHRRKNRFLKQGSITHAQRAERVIRRQLPSSVATPGKGIYPPGKGIYPPGSGIYLPGKQGGTIAHMQVAPNLHLVHLDGNGYLTDGVQYKRFRSGNGLFSKLWSGAKKVGKSLWSGAKQFVADNPKLLHYVTSQAQALGNRAVENYQQKRAEQAERLLAHEQMRNPDYVAPPPTLLDQAVGHVTKNALDFANKQARKLQDHFARQ